MPPMHDAVRVEPSRLRRVAGWASFAAFVSAVAMAGDIGPEATARIAAEDEPGVPLSVTGTVIDRDTEKPIAGARIHVYQTDAEGLYNRGKGDPEHRLAADVTTDGAGRFRLLTIRPGTYPGSHNPGHIHFTVAASGYPDFTGEILFEDDPFLTDRERRRTGSGRVIIAPVTETPETARSEAVVRIARWRFCARTESMMTGNRWVAMVLAGLCALAGAQASFSAAKSEERPALVLWITVDQLRGDMLGRFRDRFGAGGFRALMEQGVFYDNAHYGHAATWTAVGMASQATGRYAPDHGFVANGWLDAATRSVIYCVQGETRQEKTPENLLTSTLGDDLVRASGGASRVFSVSVKDRGAIIPGGHRGKAFWYSRGRFVTNPDYYYPDSGTPQWVVAWNAPTEAGEVPADRYLDAVWRLRYPAESYAAYCEPEAIDCIDVSDVAVTPFRDESGRPRRRFPYALRHAERFHGALRYTPFADELTLDFVRELVARERPGQGEATDLLAVSFSALDYVGHAFGPDSFEYEDTLLRLDATLAELLRLLDGTAGSGGMAVILTSDHGTAPVPERLQRLGYPAGRIHNDGNRLVNWANDALRHRLDTEARPVLAFVVPGFYLDPAELKRAGLDVAVVEQALAEALEAYPGIRLAVTRTELLAAGDRPTDPMLRRVRRSFHPERSANVVIVQEPSWYLAGSGDDAAMHGSPYEYDTHVPVLFAGPRIAARYVHRRVDPVQIAATVARYLGIADQVGRAHDPPLWEVLASGDEVNE
jgi:predicted AlkP superfamily pyrophosphatase or phosphodiesterase